MTPAGRARLARADSLLWPSLTAAVVVALFLSPIYNLDLWWHLDSGRWMLEHGEYLDHEVRSFSMAGAHWPNFAWLFQVMVALVERLSGGWGLLALKALAWWGLFTLLFRAIGSRGAPLSWLFPALLFSWQLVPLLHLRPHLFEGLFLAATILLMQRPHRERDLWWSAGLVLLWANVHASVVVGAAVLSLHWMLGGEYRWPGGRTLLRRLPGALLLGVRVFATPNGLDILRVLFGHAEAEYMAAYIREWAPLAAMPPFVFLALLGAAALLWFRRSLIRPGEVLLIAFFLVMAVGNKRFLFELVLLLFRPTGLLIGMGLEALASRYPRLAGRRGWRAGLAPLLLTAFTFHPPWSWKGVVAADFPVMTWRFPHVAMAVLRPVLAEVEELKAWNSYGWGGWLGWASRGRIKIYIDGRMPTVFTEGVMLQADVARHRPAMLRELLGYWKVDAVITRRYGPLPIPPWDPEWRLVAYDADLVTYLRRDLAERFGLRAIPFDPFQPVLQVGPEQLFTATAAVRELLRRDPENPLAWQHLAELLARRPDRDAAEVAGEISRALLRSIRQDPDRLMPRLRLAQWRARRHEDAASVLAPLLPWALEAGQRDITGHEVKIAQLLLDQGRPREALAMLKPAGPFAQQRLNEQPETWMIRWEAYERLGDAGRGELAENMAAWLLLDGAPRARERFRALRERLKSGSPSGDRTGESPK